MRWTRDYAVLTLDRTPASVAALMHPEFLTTARFEPVFRERLGFATLDLLFEHEEQSLVISGVLLDLVALGTLEGPVFVWPARLALTEAAGDAIEDQVFPWLRTLVRGRTAPGEEIRAYRPSALFEAARVRGFLGAAPYAQTLVTAAPFVYARRFAAGADVLVTCTDGYAAAALIGDLANSVAIVPSSVALPADIDVARQWYGELPRHAPLGPPTVAIVDDLTDPRAGGCAFAVAASAAPDVPAIVVPEPIPNDHLFTFDPADAPEAARFFARAVDAVTRPTRSVVAPAVARGSGGRVCFVLREDARYAPDADTDAADELERRLIAEGLTVGRVTAATDQPMNDADLYHVFGAAGDGHVVAAIKTAKAAVRPCVVSLEPLSSAYTRYIEDGLTVALRLGLDLTDRKKYVDAYFAGKLLIDEIPSALDDAQMKQRDRAFGRACADVLTVFLSPHDDVEAFVRRFPEIPRERVKLAGVLVGAEPAEDAIAAFLPPRRFAFMHAPLISRSNVQLVAGALDEAPFPIVIAGQVSDVDLGITLRRVSPRDAIFLPDPTPGQVAGLYRRAAIYIDASPRPTGLARIIRAAQAGAMPLVAHWSPVAPLLGRENVFDASTFETTARDISAAMARADCEARAARLAAYFAPMADPYSAFTDVVSAYAAAASTVS